MIKKVFFDKMDRVRLAGILKQKPLLGPRSVNLHLTNVCDRHCIFCWYYSPLVSRTPKARHLKFDRVRLLLNECRAMGVKTINIEGGEIDLYPRIREFFALSKTLGFRIECYSHLAFNKDGRDYLKDADLIRVNLSATDETSYRKIHGKSGFDHVVRNLIWLRDYKKDRGTPRIVLSFIVTQLNFSLLEPFFDLARKLGVDQVSVKLLSATGEMKSLIMAKDARVHFKKILTRLQSQNQMIKNNLDEVARIVKSADFMTNQRSLKWGTRHNDRYFYYSAHSGREARCFVGWFYSFIDESGRVIAPCDNVGFCVPGNILTASFKDIWFDAPAFAKMRQKAMKGIDISKGRWQECRYCGNVDFNEQVLKTLQNSRLSSGSH